MLDFNSLQNIIELIDREDRALLRSNPSARSMPEDGQEHVHSHMLLPSRSSFGCKATNLLNWCEAPIKVKQVKARPPVGHMSVFNELLPNHSDLNPLQELFIQVIIHPSNICFIVLGLTYYR